MIIAMFKQVHKKGWQLSKVAIPAIENAEKLLIT